LHGTEHLKDLLSGMWPLVMGDNTGNLPACIGDYMQ